MTYISKVGSGFGNQAMGGFLDDMMPSDLPNMSDEINHFVNAAKAVPASDPSVAGQNLTATSSGGTSITASDFASTGSSCKPRNFTAMTYAKSLQTQLNRVAQVKGFGKIGVDGDIGSGTLGLFRKVQAAGGQIMGDPSACITIAADADVLSDQVKAFADSLGAPAIVPGYDKPGTILTPAGKIVKQPGASAGLLSAFGEMSSIAQVALLGIVGGIGYVLMKGKKKKGRK